MERKKKGKIKYRLSRETKEKLKNTPNASMYKSYAAQLAEAEFIDEDTLKMVKSLDDSVFDAIREWDKSKDLGWYTSTRLLKFDEELGLVLGYAIICTEDGKDYFDTQGEHIPEDSMMKMAMDFMETSAASDEMHDFTEDGQVVFAFPLTKSVAEAFDIQTPKTGLMIGVKPGVEVLVKFKSGEYTGFSIGGDYMEVEEIDE